MAKLTLYFNHRPVNVFHLDNDVSSIGREPSNTFSIDSLAIAPSHIKISRLSEKCFIENLSEQFPTSIDNKLVRRQLLHHGDVIQLGKHTLHFSDTPDTLDLNTDTTENVYESTQNFSGRKTRPTNAILQVMNGADIGLVISLSKAVTELKTADTTPAIIAKRPTGYYLSRLMDDIDIKIDDLAISAETKLDNGSKINIANNSYTFFIE
ncbi:MAG: pSer/pThr/pTyr-binding forkhead associated (FHA) protein [Cycloclasticus sp.]|jgi:pSer/pThr/pTyr-binding forkhead associated (FHA) protein